MSWPNETHSAVGGSTAAGPGRYTERFIGKRCRLRPLLPSDYDFLYRLTVEAALRGTWRFYGPPPSPEEFERTLWSNVLTQMLIEGRDGAPVGLAVCYRADLRSGYAYLGFVLSDAGRRAVWPLEAGGLFIDYLFKDFGFRKLYGEGPDCSFDQMRSGFGRFFVEEGRLRSHVLIGGQFQDWITVAIYGDSWPRLQEA